MSCRDERNMRKIIKLSIHEVKPEPNLKPDQGWVKMQLQWLISEKTVGSKFGTLGRTIFPVGAEHEAHLHKDAEEYIIIVKGRGLQTSGDEEFEVGPGDIVFVPAGDVHRTKNLSSTEPLELYFVYAGAPSLEKSDYRRS